MRIIYSLSLLLMISVMAFSQSTTVSGTSQVNSSITDALAGRMGCGIVQVKPAMDTVVVIGNCWGAKRKAEDTAIRVRYLNPPVPEPLYVIDGVVTEGAALKSLDPNNIERIDILKEPAATAIYRGIVNKAVVVITTKKKSCDTDANRNRQVIIL